MSAMGAEASTPTASGENAIVSRFWDDVDSVCDRVDRQPGIWLDGFDDLGKPRPYHGTATIRHRYRGDPATETFADEMHRRGYHQRNSDGNLPDTTAARCVFWWPPKHRTAQLARAASERGDQHEAARLLAALYGWHWPAHTQGKT